MSNILADIVEDVQIKPSKLKLVLKWVISISLSAIVVAFTFGQIKAMRINRLDSFEKALNNSTAAMIDLRTEMKAGFDQVNARIDKGYDDGFRIFNDFQIYNNKQLGMIIDYGKSDKEMLKRMLELTTLEKTKSVETELQQAKTEPYQSNITIKQVGKPTANKNYKNLAQIVPQGSTDTIFYLTGATKEYIDKIDRKKYRVGAIIENQNYPGLFDVNYTNNK
jgi:hypothetical protein